MIIFYGLRAVVKGKRGLIEKRRNRRRVFKAAQVLNVVMGDGSVFRLIEKIRSLRIGLHQLGEKIDAGIGHALRSFRIAHDGLQWQVRRLRYGQSFRGCIGIGLLRGVHHRHRRAWIGIVGLDEIFEKIRRGNGSRYRRGGIDNGRRLRRHGGGGLGSRCLKI